MKNIFLKVGLSCLLATPVAITLATTCIAISEVRMYHYKGKLTDYLHEMEYDDYREDTEYETIKEAEPFGCSSVRKGNFYGRNFDYVYNDTPEFVVRIKHNEQKKRAESIAICTHFGLREKSLLEGKYDRSLELIPNLTMDGINEYGVICSSNVVSMEPNKMLSETGVAETNPGKGLKKLHALFIPRYVLDNATSAKDAVRRLQEDVNIFGNLKDEMNLHIMIADKDETYVVEFFPKSSKEHFDVVAKLKDGSEDAMPIMTNCYVNIDKTNPEFENQEKFGNERFEILKAHYNETEESLEGMYSLMRYVTFSKAYDKTIHDHIPYNLSHDLSAEWYSEKIKQKLLVLYDKNLPYDQQVGELGDGIRALIATQDAYINKKREERNPAFWITTHNSTYDIQNKILRITVQENYEWYKDFQL